MTSLRNTLPLALFLLFPLGLAALAFPDQPEQVVVVSVAGDWKFGDARVTWGQALPAKGCLYASEGSVVLRAGNSVSRPDNKDTQPFACEKKSRDSDCSGHESDRCAIPLDPAKWKSKFTLGNFMDFVTTLISREPEKYMVAASRGLEPGLVDCVALLKNSSVDLAPAFREMPAGTYFVILSSVNTVANANTPVELRFTPHGPAVVTLPAVQPGLYRVVLVDKQGAPAGSDCWALISSPDSYTSISGAFEAAVQKSAAWPDDMDPSARRAILRAYLDSLRVNPARTTP